METRTCPGCGIEVKYKRRAYCLAAIRKNQTCRACVNKNRKTEYAGEGNPFFGKKHSDEAKEKIASYEHEHVKTEWFRKLRSEQFKGEKNPVWGTSNYEIWIAKFGIAEADRLEAIRREKLSEANSGDNNPMYGRPSPQGSGNGWSGWYKNWYFRSLRELSYMINVIELNQLKWRSAETADLKIKYNDWEGKERTYTADFLVDEKYLVEVKPKKLKSSRVVRLKQEAANVFCNKKGYEYQIVDPVVLTDGEFKELYLTKQIKFIKRYEDLFLERYGT